jgi:tRNA-specific 2-thiouridylase
VTNTVTVGAADQLDVLHLEGVRPIWCGPAPAVPIECLAQVRAHGDPVPAVAWLDGAALRVELRQALRGVAPGQAVVLYDDTRVVGSATISRATA